ncbi:MAG TPA: 50S ribosomal L9 C-terminal domain-containing protein [Candidatus Sumerlaeia bacterium]|nr:50S ribosomal L9 C-terminal domain-containing protein [Candidatus Sumerlaeia bacterium]
MDKKKIHLPEPIKSLGEFPVEIKLHPEVTTKVTVVVEKAE